MTVIFNFVCCRYALSFFYECIFLIAFVLYCYGCNQLKIIIIDIKRTGNIALVKYGIGYG